MPWQELPASQFRALLKKSLATRRSRILDLAAEVGPVIEEYRAQSYGYRRIAALLNLSDYTPPPWIDLAPDNGCPGVADLHDPTRATDAPEATGGRQHRYVTSRPPQLPKRKHVVVTPSLCVS